MSPALATSVARRASLSLIPPDPCTEWVSRSPSPLPSGISPLSKYSPFAESPLTRPKRRRLSLPDTCPAQQISCGLGKERHRRSSLGGPTGQAVASSRSALQAPSTVGTGREGGGRDAPHFASLTKEQELEWWEDFTPEEQAEMRRVALDALQEWAESNQVEAEDWLDSSTVQKLLRDEEVAEGEQLAVSRDAACSLVEHFQVLALDRSLKLGGKEQQGLAAAPLHDAPKEKTQPLATLGLDEHARMGGSQDAVGVASTSELEQQVGEAEQKASGGGNWFTRITSSVDARLRGLILLNLLTFLYGSNVSVLKNSVSLLDPATFQAGRFGIGSLAFSPWLWKAIRDPRIRRAGGELGLWASTAYLTQAVALQTSDAGRVSFISTFTVIFVPLLAGFFGKKISSLTWVSAAAALLGVGLLESSGAPPAVGDLWALVSALLFGVQMLRTEHHSRSLRKEDSMALIGLQMTVTGAASALWALIGHLHSGDLTVLNALVTADLSTLAHGFSGVPWWPMLYTGVFSTALCLWIEVVSLHDVSATEAALVYTIEPLWGAGFAWLLLGERWGPLGWVGAALILGGSMTTQLFGKEEAKHEHSSSSNSAGQISELRANSGEGAASLSNTNFVDVDSFTRALSLYALSEAADKATKAGVGKVAGSNAEPSEDGVVVGPRIVKNGVTRRTGR